MKIPNPLEKDIERSIVEFARGLKMLVYKFTSPARSHVPDRLFITNYGHMFFMELKRKGQKPTPAQAVEIGKIRATGVQVYVVDNVERGKRIVSTLAISNRFIYDLNEY